MPCTRLLSFSCGYYAVSSVSVSAATHQRTRMIYIYIYYQVCILIRTYADLTFFFFLRHVYDLFKLSCVLCSVFICFPPEAKSGSQKVQASMVRSWLHELEPMNHLENLGPPRSLCLFPTNLKPENIRCTVPDIERTWNFVFRFEVNGACRWQQL